MAGHFLLPSRLKEALGSLSARLLVAFLLPTLLFLALTGTAVYALARSILEDELGTSLSAIAAATASQVSGERMLTIEPGDDTAGTRTWRNLVRLLTEVQEASGVCFRLLTGRCHWWRARLFWPRLRPCSREAPLASSGTV